VGGPLSLRKKVGEPKPMRPPQVPPPMTLRST